MSFGHSFLSVANLQGMTDVAKAVAMVVETAVEMMETSVLDAKAVAEVRGLLQYRPGAGALPAILSVRRQHWSAASFDRRRALRQWSQANATAHSAMADALARSGMADATARLGMADSLARLGTMAASVHLGMAAGCRAA